MAKVQMPQLGESVAEGTIGKWLKKPGDHVAKYEPLLEVITDKVNAEVPSPFEGTLTEILVQEGETVPNNAEIAVIEETVGAGAGQAGASGPPPAAQPPASAEAPAAAPVAASAAPTQGAPASSQEPGASAVSPPASSSVTPPASDTAPDGQAPGGRPSIPAQPVETTSPMPAHAPGSQTAAAAVAGAIAAAPTSGLGDGDARMSPAVRRLLRENSLSPDQIVGTGGGGRITRDDVAAFLATGAQAAQGGAQAAQGGAATGDAATPTAAVGGPPAGGSSATAAPAAAPPSAPAARAQPAAGARVSSAPAAPPLTFEPGQDEQLVPWTQMRRGVANAMVRSTSTVPHASTTVEVDATNLVRLREAHKDEFRAREGASLSYVPFLVKAVVEALRKHPRINAHWTENGLLVKRRINVGIAVAVEDGLIVPVIHDADQLSISGLNRAILDVAERARTNRLRLDDLQGGTITINNTGTFGSVVSSSIINMPEVAIVNLEAIVKRPVVISTPEGDAIAVRSMVNVPVVFDHRSTDGAQIGRFVADIKAWLEAIGPETPIY